MDTEPRSGPHSVKRWQLSGTDYEAQLLGPQTLFSSWTPLSNRKSNLQLFEERTKLVLHWFDLWTDQQRKHLLHSLLARCTKSQLKSCRDLLMETVPVTQVDFTSLLPRFLSLYVMSFLSPRDLCAAAQVSWHWRVLAEQDCIWASRCIRRGWFLPYAPREKEFGAWKSHYVSCVSRLDWLSPGEALERYGAAEQRISKEEEERRKERWMRHMLREKLQQEKGMSLRNRRAWGSSVNQASRGRGADTWRPNSGARSLSWPPKTVPSSGLSLSRDGDKIMSAAQSMERVRASDSFRSLNKACAVLSSFTLTPDQSQTLWSSLLLLISDRIPAYELVLSGVKAGVVVVLYDHRGTLADLATRAERALCGQKVQRVGLLAPGGTEKIQILQNWTLSEKTLLTPEHRGFWEKLCVWVVASEDGGGIDFFSPLAGSVSGVTLIQTLSTLTGLDVCAPMGIGTGSFQNILGEWSDLSGQSHHHPAGPALQYMWDHVLQTWCTQAKWMEEALQELRTHLGPQLRRVSLQAGGRALGHFLWDKIRLEEICVSKDLSEALTEGLTTVTAQEETRPVEFLAAFLTTWRRKKDDVEERPKRADDPSATGHGSHTTAMVVDWRGVMVRELLHSEALYLGRLGAVLKVYQEPLAAALNSQRAILSFTDIHGIFNPVTQILQLNSVFHEDVAARLRRWSVEQCVGDVFVKLCSRLRVYTNYLNNYTTAMSNIDKCRETKPKFRAFLKRVDRTLPTHMLSLQELLLCPVWRIQEYVALLQALSLHTLDTHPDHTHLCSALDSLQQYTHFIHKLKRSTERDQLMEETQQMIRGCPNLSEGNRQLLTTQDAALLKSPDQQIPDSLRTYEHVADVGLFLFTDALVLTRRNVCHVPFTLTHRSRHTFLASVALTSLSVREITHSQYVCHAFVLDAPSRSWVCATESGEDGQHFLSVLRSAIDSALRENR